MNEFFQALTDPSISFLRYAFIAGLLSSIAFGITGTFVVVKRISYIAGAISHCVLSGIGIALYVQHRYGLLWCTPLIGAICAAILSALVIGCLSMYVKDREDSIIGALWVIGMAVGLLFIAKTPGYIDPMSYLFGNILMITKADIWIIVILDILILTSVLLWYNQLLAMCFDEEFAELRGVKTKVCYLLLLCIVALTIVLLIRIVGIVLVIALLTLPAATSGIYGKKLWQMMIISILLCLLYISSGIGISYSADLPTGATIVVFAGFFYLIGINLKTVLSKFLKK